MQSQVSLRAEGAQSYPRGSGHGYLRDRKRRKTGS